MDICPKADFLPTSPPVANSEARAFIDRRKGLHSGTAQSALTVTFKLVIGALTRVILTVLGTVNLQFQGQFVFRYFEASSWNRGSLYVTAIAWS